MRLIDNWQRTLTHGYSAWGVYAAIAVNVAFEALPFINDWVSRKTVIVILLATLVVRIIKQTSITGKDADEPA